MRKLILMLLVSLIILTLLSNINLFGQDRELHLYQTDPPCKNAKVAYLLFQGKHNMDIEYRVYVCGYVTK